MLLNQIAKRFGALVGKGLPWTVIGEVFLLSLPFIVAMTLPMAVLLAVLYAFTTLASSNEITAMRASGVSIGQLLRPVFAAALLLTAADFAFVDQGLPATNLRLKALQFDIGRKRPTLELREETLNEVPPNSLFLQAGRIYPADGRLRDVTIYDMSGQQGKAAGHLRRQREDGLRGQPDRPVPDALHAGPSSSSRARTPASSSSPTSPSTRSACAAWATPWNAPATTCRRATGR